MPSKDHELLYRKAVEWINKNPQDKSISDEIKQDFLCLNTLHPENKVQLLITLNTLLKTTGLPQEIENSLPWLMFDLEALPNELIFKIGTHLEKKSEMINLVSCSKQMHAFFQPRRLLDRFLERVAYGEQDKAEQLFTDVYQGDVEKIQQALLHRGRFTDYSGRTFHCTAYEYAYWAKDARMCLMLERYMDDATQAKILVRINEIERIDIATGKPVGLKYQQNDAEHQSAHFDLSPLITALRNYINGYSGWENIESWHEMRAAWMQVGIEQRNLPVHVINEYAHPERGFDPRSTFSEETLLRRVRFHNLNDENEHDLYPLVLSERSGLGVNFALYRGRVKDDLIGWQHSGGPGMGDRGPLLDLQALINLDQLRTADLRQLRENLLPSNLQPSHTIA